MMKQKKASSAVTPPGADIIGRPAPDIGGIDSWLNTRGGAPVHLAALRGKVVLVDFWSYSCINCRRAIAHVVDWRDRYDGFGFEAIGVHSPEYTFECVPDNVARAAAGLRMTYPIALDNGLTTWRNYRNAYLPAQYLIDTSGIVRHIRFGEGDYSVTEKLIRTLLVSTDLVETLPPATLTEDATPPSGLTGETYLSVGKALFFGGTGDYRRGETAFDFPPELSEDKFAYRGTWTLDDEGATAGGEASSIRLNYYAKDVYLIAGGDGEMSVMRDGVSNTLPITGPPDLHQIVAGDVAGRGHLEVQFGRGMQAVSFSYG
jgi:hypothetical protein